MSERELQIIVEQIVRQMSSQTHFCLHAEEWGAIRKTLENIESDLRDIKDAKKQMNSGVLVFISSIISTVVAGTILYLIKGGK